MAVFDLESIIKKGAAKVLNKPIVDGKSVVDWAKIGMKAPRWISVKDRMPDVGDIVLFTGMSSFGTRFITQRGWFDGTFWKRDTGETVYSSTPVTHWMPLPGADGLDES